jgi:hypothetical protein
MNIFRELILFIIDFEATLLLPIEDGGGYFLVGAKTMFDGDSQN